MEEPGAPRDRELNSADHLALMAGHAAHNYAPLDVVIASGEGAWVTDVDGRRYLDALAGYSALNFGHRHPQLIKVAVDQLHRLTLTSRAFHAEPLGPFCRALAGLTGKDMVLPMNSGAEAVETALKVARRWGHDVRGVAPDRGTVIVMDGNFHGRTTTIISFSTDEDSRRGFGPYTPGFTVVPYGDVEAIRQAITDDTVAVLLEPIQGEAGVIIPPDGFLREVRELCTRDGVLLIADEIQSGLARTGRTFACDHEDVAPDVYVLGKALGGGIMPVSAIAADRAVMDVITPGSHGSTFGGNPLAAAIGHEVVRMLSTGHWQQRATELGAVLTAGLQSLTDVGVVAVRSRGLWAGVDIDQTLMSGKELCRRLADRGVLAKDTHGSTIRLAPPLVVEDADLELLVDTLRTVLVAAG
ncbi:ornithine--oxo-acid transaminase [Propionibacteriaceae bacterium Y2011]|uniref:ornithine--oxo-acid transaminase n=1 Tax=Microlunatus sp. Y2014 TaxID=3418488 RepID=UPI003B4E2301